MRPYPKNLYGGSAPHRDVATSRQAAADATPKAMTVGEHIRQMIQSKGPLGCTGDELVDLVQRPMASVSARLRELVLLGKIAPQGDMTRRTRYGKQARVYVTPEFLREGTGDE